MFLWAQGRILRLTAAMSVTRHLIDKFNSHFAFEIFFYPALSLLPKFTKKLIKITTNKFSFPQVQVLNGSQKPSKLGMQWIYRRYYCTWSPEFSLRVNHQHEEIKFVSLGSHATFFFYYMDIDETSKLKTTSVLRSFHKWPP